jgi:hypothetical protein
VRVEGASTVTWSGSSSTGDEQAAMEREKSSVTRVCQHMILELGFFCLTRVEHSTKKEFSFNVFDSIRIDEEFTIPQSVINAGI